MPRKARTSEPPPVSEPMSTIERLDDLAGLVTQTDGLYVRWSRGPDADLRPGHTSRDTLTGAELPGLPASPLAVETWWDGRSPELWVARRLHDYRHLRDRRGPGVRPWVLVGTEVGRGPDNEPLVRCERPVAWISENVLDLSRKLVEDQAVAEWGSLDRAAAAET